VCPEAVTDHANSLHVLQFGAELVPRSLSVAGGGPLLGWEPICGFLVETDDGPVLLETGMHPRTAADPEVQAGYARAAEGAGLSLDDVPPAELWPGGRPGVFAWARPLEEVLAEHGVHVADLALSAVSHLHVDHTGGLPALALARVPVAIQAAELAFAATPEALEGGLHPPDIEGHDVRWQVLEGDARLAPGVHALATPGHTPGHMSYRVELAQTGTWVLAVDAADLGQNVLDLAPPGSCGAGEDAARASVRRLVDEANRRHARLLPGHDQLALNLAASPPGGHR
jgi:glyoxylase-like metal-dependent hydrolase (beta-lactamase superfamily II)